MTAVLQLLNSQRDFLWVTVQSRVQSTE